MIHDRSIMTDTGWKILLGRGLDIFQRMSDSPFDLATKHQKYRELKAFGITYLRDSVHGTPPARSEDDRPDRPVGA
jgi:ATP-dependent Lon protease